MSTYDDDRPPFPSGFGEEADQAAWDYARSVGRAHLREFHRRHDRVMGAVIGLLLVPTMTVGTVLAAAGDEWWWAVLFGAFTVIIAVCSFGMYRGWAYR